MIWYMCETKLTQKQKHIKNFEDSTVLNDK